MPFGRLNDGLPYDADQISPVVSAIDRQAAGLAALFSVSTPERSGASGAFDSPQASSKTLPRSGRHARPPASPLEPVLPPRLHTLVIAHVRRVFSFSLIGLVVLVAGIPNINATASQL
jgi:hypothetical protein